MTDHEKPAERALDGLSGVVQLAAEHPEHSPKSSTRQHRDRYPHTPGHKGDPTGPGADSARYYTHQVSGRRRQVLDGLARVGPATAEEIAETINLHWYLTRPRLSELKALGLVIETGARGRGALGGSVSQWRLTSPDERSLFLARKAAENEPGERPHG